MSFMSTDKEEDYREKGENSRFPAANDNRNDKSNRNNSSNRNDSGNQNDSGNPNNSGNSNDNDNQ